MRVLIVDHRAAGLEAVLSRHGFNCYTSDDPGEATDLVHIYAYDCVITDTKLGKVDGVDMIRDIRRANNKTPVIVVSGDESTETKLRAFAAGADDYLTRPFGYEELVARMRAVIGRYRKVPSREIKFQGGLRINTENQETRVDDKPIHLTQKEYLFLECLAVNIGRTMTKDQLLQYIYGHEDSPELKIIDIFAHKVRKKLALAAGEDIEFVVTNWGRGYVIPEEMKK